MPDEGTHLAKKSHNTGPLQSTAHPPKKPHKRIHRGPIQFQSLHPVGVCVRYEGGAKIYESTEEVTEDSVCRGYTSIIEPSEALMEQIQKGVEQVGEQLQHGKQKLCGSGRH